ncbi:MAG: hypothetical protein IBX62_07425 [Coriobacteriia bacterium]|nr:hypothetical protein [Coriobacteriia bacterium]
MPCESGEGFDRVFEVMPQEARASVRARVVSGARAGAACTRARRLSVHALVLLAAVSTAGTGVAYASGAALPGDALFGVKLAIEEAAITAAPTAGMRTALAERSAMRRADEVAALARGGAEAPDVGVAVGRLEAAARRALRDGRASGGAEGRLRERVQRVPAPAKESAERALEKARDKAADKARDEVSPVGGSKARRSGNGEVPRGKRSSGKDAGSEKGPDKGRGPDEGRGK